MGVSPEAHFRVFSQVLVSDVQAAEIPDYAVHDHDLPVISIIEASGKKGAKRRGEASGFRSGLMQPIHIRLIQFMAADSVINQLHLNPFPGFTDQQLLKAESQLIVTNDIKLDMNMMSRRSDGLKHVFKGFSPLREHRRLIAGRNR
ncbi:hypothetical protein D3C71_1516650 [compost metagenome]